MQRELQTIQITFIKLYYSLFEFIYKSFEEIIW